jgi:hypothetical protein
MSKKSYIYQSISHNTLLTYHSPFSHINAKGKQKGPKKIVV